MKRLLMASTMLFAAISSGEAAMAKKVDKETLANKIKALAGLDAEERSELLGLLSERKKYGLVWEEKPEDVEEVMREQLPVLAEVKERAIVGRRRDKRDGSDERDEFSPIPSIPSIPNHILIEGDNLHALTCLTYTHSNKVDVIYIDPPYNTGNKDFVYNDRFVDKEDAFRHSKWLSFMEKRLRIAKGLMSDRGVIFISIDDNEQAQLKLLCDEIFGEENFVANISWQRTYSIRNDSKGIPREVEHILVYAHSTNWQPSKLPRTAGMDELYKNPDNDEKPWTSSSCSAPGASTHQGMVYAIQHPFTGKLMYPSTGRHWALGQEGMLENLNKWCAYELRDIGDSAKRAEVCGISESAVKKNVQAIMLKDTLEDSKKKAKVVMGNGPWPYFYFTNGGKGGLRRKTYISDVGGRISTNFFSSEEAGHTDEAKKEIIALFGGNAVFDTPKPTRLIQRILQISGTNVTTVLDFFAGSGTTLHAVMKLNAEDGGKRTCILVTNNENGICEKVTYERNRRVIQGYTNAKGEAVPGLTENSLRYYKTEFVPRKPSPRNARALMAASVDLLCVKNDLYDEVPRFFGKKLKKSAGRYFDDGSGRRMLVLFDETTVPSVAEAIRSASFKGKVKIYVFAHGDYAYNEEFEEVADKVELCALPAAILNAYRRVIGKYRPKEEDAK